MTSRADDFGVPAHARTAWDHLHDLIARTGPTPCAGRHRDRWSGSVMDQAWAAEQCLDCPAMTACAAYADTATERHGVWGGLTARERGKR